MRKFVNILFGIFVVLCICGFIFFAKKQSMLQMKMDGINSAGAEVYTWLAEHAHEYGFIQRYPEDKTEITGINYEPWHYRYVGEDMATKIYEEDICLEEYIEANFTK